MWQRGKIKDLFLSMCHPHNCHRLLLIFLTRSCHNPFSIQTVLKYFNLFTVQWMTSTMVLFWQTVPWNQMSCLKFDWTRWWPNGQGQLRLGLLLTTQQNWSTLPPWPTWGKYITCRPGVLLCSFVSVLLKTLNQLTSNQDYITFK